MDAIAFNTAHQTEPADETATLMTQLQPPGSDIVSEAIPAFFIGRNGAGFWVARHAKGNVGGIFLFEGSALSFAGKHSRPTGCATVFPRDRFELDLENQGNPFITPLMRLMKRAALARQRAAATGGLAAAVKRRTQHFLGFRDLKRPSTPPKTNAPPLRTVRSEGN
jgi:hypothetical protein